MSGSIGGAYHDHSLTVTLTPRVLQVEPSIPSKRVAPATLALDSVILAHVHRSRLTPRLELFFETSRGPGSCAFSPRDLRLWVEYFEELGVVLRPRPLDVQALPCNNLGYRARLVALAVIGTAGAVGLTLSLIRLVIGS